jgi:hypothetical protein
MKADISFMSELFRIVNGALRLDIDKERNYTAFLAEKLEKAGDVSSATRLRKMLEKATSSCGLRALRLRRPSRG